MLNSSYLCVGMISHVRVSMRTIAPYIYCSQEFVALLHQNHKLKYRSLVVAVVAK